MRLVLSFLMALSAVAVLVLGAAPASAMTGEGGCHKAAAMSCMDHGPADESPATSDARVMHCCVACTPQTALPVAVPVRLAVAARLDRTPPDRLGRAPAPDPHPPRG